MGTYEDSATLAGTATFRHEALLYSGQEGFLAGTVPFIRGALEADEAVLALVSGPKVELLREELGDDARDVEFADMRAVGNNPARIIPAWRDFAQTRAAG